MCCELGLPGVDVSVAFLRMAIKAGHTLSLD
jgi:hypothetical protein